MKVHPARSIFVKLMGAYGIAFLLIIGGAAAARFRSAASSDWEVSNDKIRDYARFLVREIGTPPDISVAEDTAFRTGLHIAVTGPDLRWTSSGSIARDEGDFPSFLPDMADPVITVDSGPYRYYFSDFHSDLPLTFHIWLILGGSIVIALILSYLMVRHLLKPLRKMNRVALALGEGDWKERVNPGGGDEFAVLGKTIDSMADRIENYIQSMHDLLAAISHELRSPLTRMKVALEFVENDKIRTSLNEEIGLLDRMTGNLLEQRRLSEGNGLLNRTDFSLFMWIDEVCRPYVLEDFPLELRKEGSDITVNLDQGRMDLAVRNLLENCRRYAPESPVDLTLRTEYEGPGFILEVADRGPGIDESLIPRIGEPFMRADSSRTGKRDKGGFGLGMSIVKAIAEAHGADFSVANRSGGGLSVKLKFTEMDYEP